MIGGNHRETWISIDLTPVFDDPDVLDIVDATLRIPLQDSTGSANADLHEANQAWTEDQLTWNNRPDYELEAFGGEVSDDPHTWDVQDEIQSMFTFGPDRANWLVVVEPHGSTALEASAEYDSREAGTGQQAELEIETTEQRRADLDSSLEVSKSGAADLDGFVEPRFFSGVYHLGRTGVALDALHDSRPDLQDLMWDETRSLVWGLDRLDDQGGADLLLPAYDRDGALQRSFRGVGDGDLFDEPTSGGIAGDDLVVVLGRFNDTAQLFRFTIDAANDALDFVSQEGFAHNDLDPRGIAWDPSADTWWIAWTDDTVEEFNRALDTKLATLTGLDVELGSAPAGETFLVAVDRATRDVVRIDKATGDVVQRMPVETEGDFPRPNRLWGDTWLERLWYMTDSDEVTLLTSMTVDSTVRPGAVPREVDLSSTVKPGSVPDHADLSSSVSTGDDADLTSSMTPRVEAVADLSSTVQPGSLARTDDHASIVEVQAVPIDDSHEARTEGRVAPTIVVDEDDMADVSGEVGTAITVDGEDVRRVVQVLDTPDDWPRARADPATTLNRGDAVLYAESGDDFSVGDVVAWGGRSWEVVGFLGWETIGDSRLYQEIGLRRLATVHEARARGTVQRTDHVDLYSEVEANVV